jgi:hypothetical protein
VFTSPQINLYVALVAHLDSFPVHVVERRR